MTPSALQHPQNAATPSQLTDVRRASQPDLDWALAIFLAERTRLFWIAHRIVGNLTAAEDVVQEAWFHWQRTNHGEVNNPAALLTTATARLAINMIQSAALRHETPAGTPPTDLVDRSQDPSKQAEQAAAIEQGLSMLMARLTPSERAVYLLRKGFDYPYGDIAQILRISVPNARQLARRAQRNLVTGRLRRVDPDLHHQLVRAFLRAARTGDLAEIERLLVPDDCRAARRTRRSTSGVA